MIYYELDHFSHPNHMLQLAHSLSPYTCDGCMELGFGSRYRCNTCDFDLHKECASVSSSPITHPFFRKCVFKFIESGEPNRYCNACARDINGFVYHCDHCGRDLHPCCVNLPRLIQDADVKLVLRDRVSSKCHKCERKKLAKRQTWSYVSACKEYYFHVSCVKDLLLETWEKAYSFYDWSTEANMLALGSITPRLQIALCKGKVKKRYKFEKYLKVAKVILKFIISVIVGDPTALIGGIIASLISS